MGLKELAVQRQDIFYIDPREITVLPGWNARNLVCGLILLMGK